MARKRRSTRNLFGAECQRKTLSEGAALQIFRQCLSRKPPAVGLACPVAAAFHTEGTLACRRESARLAGLSGPRAVARAKRLDAASLSGTLFAMKNLLLSLAFCALAFAPRANAQPPIDCSAWLPCQMDPSCIQCHDQAYPCYWAGYCLDCNQLCVMEVSATTKRDHPVTSPRSADGRVHMRLNDMGMAFLAAIMPDVLKSPSGSGALPKGHPPVSAKAWQQLASKGRGTNGCKAPVGVQMLALSMLRH